MTLFQRSTLCVLRLLYDFMRAAVSHVLPESASAAPGVQLSMSSFILLIKVFFQLSVLYTDPPNARDRPDTALRDEFSIALRARVSATCAERTCGARAAPRGASPRPAPQSIGSLCSSEPRPPDHMHGCARDPLVSTQRARAAPCAPFSSSDHTVPLSPVLSPVVLSGRSPPGIRRQRCPHRPHDRSASRRLRRRSP